MAHQIESIPLYPLAVQAHFLSIQLFVHLNLGIILFCCNRYSDIPKMDPENLKRIKKSKEDRAKSGQQGRQKGEQLKQKEKQLMKEKRSNP